MTVAVRFEVILKNKVTTITIVDLLIDFSRVRSDKKAC